MCIYIYISALSIVFLIIMVRYAFSCRFSLLQFSTYFVYTVHVANKEKDNKILLAVV